MTNLKPDSEWTPIDGNFTYGKTGRIEKNSAGQVRIVDTQTGRIVGPEIPVSDKPVDLQERKQGSVLKK